MFIIQVDTSSNSSRFFGNFSLSDLSDLSDLAQVLIAAINIGLAVYIIIYQRKKDFASERLSISQNERNIRITASLNEQNIRLQWFKELVIQPNIEVVYKFYSNLHSLRNKIDTDNLSEDQILLINEFIKEQASEVRKYFIDIILHVDKDLYQILINNIDELVTTLTQTISDDEHKLTNPKTFERFITKPINYSKNNLIATIYNFKATPSNNPLHI